MDVVMIYFYSKRFRFAPSFNNVPIVRVNSKAKIYRNSCKLINGCCHDLLL